MRSLLALLALLSASPCSVQDEKPPARTSGSAGGEFSQARSPITEPGQQNATSTVRFETPRGPWLVAVEVVRTPEDRARGLMYRRNLPPDRGMLFIFDETGEHGFWMHNTLLALDMIFLGEDRAVVGVVAHAQPKTDTPRSVHQASRYVVEVAAGEAAAHAVGPGARAVFLSVDE